MTRPRVRDVLLFACVGALGLAAAVDAVRSHQHVRGAPAPRRAPAPPPAAAAPPLVALRGSPETAFLPDCRRGDVRLSIESVRRELVLRRSGGRCHLPALRFEATVSDGLGTLLYRGPALARGGFEGANLAGPGTVAAPLLPGLLHCDVQAPLRIVVRGGGLSARGAIRCRGSL
jgi:hypothetical protein